jgi:hypothetical protein
MVKCIKKAEVGMGFAYVLSISRKSIEEDTMTKEQLEKKVARLEFVHDQLDSEITYVDNLLKSVGFPRGLASAKEVALELLDESNQSGSS